MHCISTHTKVLSETKCYQKEVHVIHDSKYSRAIVTLWFSRHEQNVLSRRETDLALVWWQFSSLFVPLWRDGLPGGPCSGISHNRPVMANGDARLKSSQIYDFTLVFAWHNYWTILSGMLRSFSKEKLRPLSKTEYLKSLERSFNHWPFSAC